MANSKTHITKDLQNRQLNITRPFEAPLRDVWEAWTSSELLEQWWAPRPWKAITKSMNFNEGGCWLYYMQGPEGEVSYCRVDFKTIVPSKSFSAVTNFCDGEGNINQDFPAMHWLCEFSETATGTMVKITVTFDKLADMEKIVEMGFEGGFTMAHGNLDELLAGKK